MILVIKELTPLELLKLSLEYSISKKHQRSLVERIGKLEGKPEVKKVRQRKVQVAQESFL